MTIELYARRIIERCEILARYSEEPERLTRRFATPAMQQVNTLVAEWMRATTMVVRQDQAGNIIGRYAAQDSEGRRPQTLLLGSHLDTVRDAGKYDGILGVILALALVERLHEQRIRLPFALEVIGFADEEGMRYHHPFIGSTALAGTFALPALQLLDSDGITMASALQQFGGDPEHIQAARRDPGDLLGYCEIHIEQGPVLETEQLPVGIVTAITGQSRCEVIFRGRAGHAGTVPMSNRQDALCAAASFVLAAEQGARAIPGMMTTIGQLHVQPGASNVIPGTVTLSLDLRHPDDSKREQFYQQLHKEAQKIANERQMQVEWNKPNSEQTVACSPQLTQLLTSAVKQQGYRALLLPSGAGHDAAIMAELTEICMLFVRCYKGISHHPDEAVNTADIIETITVMENFLQLLAHHTQEERHDEPV